MEGLAAAQGCFTAWVAVLFVVGALYASLMIGVTGGPNKGDHPMIVTVLHWVAFLVWARGWTRGDWWAYVGVLAAATVLSVVAVGLTRAPAGRLWLARGTMLALHAGLFWIAAFGA